MYNSTLFILEKDMENTKFQEISTLIDALNDDSITKFFIYTTILKMITSPNKMCFEEAFPSVIHNSFLIRGAKYNVFGFEIGVDKVDSLSSPKNNEALIRHNIFSAFPPRVQQQSNIDNVLSNKINQYCEEFFIFEPGIETSLLKVFNTYFHKKGPLYEASFILEKIRDSLNDVNSNSVVENKELYEAQYGFAANQQNLQDFLSHICLAQQYRQAAIKQMFYCFLLVITFSELLRQASMGYDLKGKDNLAQCIFLSLLSLTMYYALHYKELKVKNDKSANGDLINIIKHKEQHQGFLDLITSNVILPAEFIEHIEMRQLPFIRDKESIEKQIANEQSASICHYKSHR